MEYEKTAVKKPLTLYKPERIIPNVINKIKRRNKMTTTKELKTKNTNVLDTMSSLSILFYVFKRHYAFIITVAFVLSWVYMFIRQFAK